MNSKKRQIIYLFILLLIPNNQYSQAHDSLNGGCRNHCEESLFQKTSKKKLENIYNKYQIKDSYSCLKKSLCRG